jgi:hypothetical protein
MQSWFSNLNCEKIEKINNAAMPAKGLVFIDYPFHQGWDFSQSRYDSGVLESLCPWYFPNRKTGSADFTGVSCPNSNSSSSSLNCCFADFQLFPDIFLRPL